MTYTVHYAHLLNTRALARFPRSDLQLIRKRIEEKLTIQPDLFGKPLRRSLHGYWSLRIADYRIIYRIEGRKVLVFIIEHRSVVYETARRFLT